MTLQEIKEWVKTAKFILTTQNECDYAGNHYAKDIFEKDGKYYSIQSVNGKIMPRLSGIWAKEQNDYWPEEVEPQQTAASR